MRCGNFLYYNIILSITLKACRLKKVLYYQLWLLCVFTINLCKNFKFITYNRREFGIAQMVALRNTLFDTVINLIFGWDDKIVN